MLTELEKKSCQKLLEVVNDSDLRCLVQTITQNLVAIESRQGDARIYNACMYVWSGQSLAPPS